MRKLVLKKMMIVLVSIFCFSPVSAQVSQQQADKLDSLITKLVNQERYSDAIDTQKKRLDILKELHGETDTTYIEGLVFLGKYYARNQQLDEAIKTLRKATSLYEENISSSDGDFAYYLDNLAFYLSAAQQTEEAELIGRRALSIYEKKGKLDEHLAAILLHLAETCHENKRYQEAIQFELRSLSIIKKLMGEHSEEYINELAYLQKFYESAGEKERVDNMKERIDKLVKERNEGYVDLPKLVEFKTPEICHMHNNDALRCCAYFLTHRLSAPNMNEAAKYILNWSYSTADVHIEINEMIGQFLTNQNEMAYMIAYTAATSYYCLTQNHEWIDEEGYVRVMHTLLDFYDQNKDLSGKIDSLENYLKLRKKEKLDQQLLKDYQKLRESSKSKM